MTTGTLTVGVADFRSLIVDVPGSFDADLAGIRDYAELLRERPHVTPPVVMSSWGTP